jgi:hypothetical protein
MDGTFADGMGQGMRRHPPWAPAGPAGAAVTGVRKAGGRVSRTAAGLAPRMGLLTRHDQYEPGIEAGA